MILAESIFCLLKGDYNSTNNKTNGYCGNLSIQHNTRNNKISKYNDNKLDTAPTQ